MNVGETKRTGIAEPLQVPVPQKIKQPATTKKTEKVKVLALIVLALVLGGGAYGQSAAPAAPTSATPTSAPAPEPYKCADTVKYCPTELQHLRLDSLQKAAIITQQQITAVQAQLQQGQATFQAQLKALTDEAARIKDANKWDASVQFDPNTIIFSEPPPKEDKKDVSKK